MFYALQLSGILPCCVRRTMMLHGYGCCQVSMCWWIRQELNSSSCLSLPIITLHLHLLNTDYVALILPREHCIFTQKVIATCYVTSWHTFKNWGGEAVIFTLSSPDPPGQSHHAMVLYVTLLAEDLYGYQIWHVHHALVMCRTYWLMVWSFSNATSLRYHINKMVNQLFQQRTENLQTMN